MTDETGKQLPLFEVEPSNTQYQAVDPDQASVDTTFSKYIVYVDESGDHGLQSIDPEYPVFVLAFCVFHKRHYSEAIVPMLEKFKFNYFGHDQVVLHEHEIRKERGNFNIFNSREEKNKFIGQLTQIITNSNFILISCTIDKESFRKQFSDGHNPYNIALASCMETLYEFLEEKGEHKNTTHVIVECRGSKEDQDLELEFRRICDGRNRFGKGLPFDVIFSDKKVMSTGLQLADLVARPIGLNWLRPTQKNRAFDVLKEKFYCEGGRKSAGSGYEGVGMKILPPPESEKPR